MDTITRLAKVLSRHGVASRRKSEDIIRQGRVMVNNIKVLDPAYQVNYKLSSVTVDGIKIKLVSQRTYVALYKPIKHISDLNYDDDRALARELLPGKEYLFPVGRLDYNSEGLMLFTDDGEFAYRISHPKFEVDKEYEVKFKGRPEPDIVNQVRKGLLIDGERFPVKEFQHVRDTNDNTWYRVIVTEGKNRMLRRIGEAIGHPVLKLKRTRIGPVHVSGLKPGESRKLTQEEIEVLSGLPGK